MKMKDTEDALDAHLYSKDQCFSKNVRSFHSVCKSHADILLGMA